MKEEERFEKFLDEFNELSFRDKFTIYKNYVSYYGDDEEWFDMYSFNELNSGVEPLGIVDMVCGNNFNTSDEFFHYTIYGVESGDKEDVEDAINDIIEDIYNSPSESEWEEFITLEDEDEDDDDDDEDEFHKCWDNGIYDY